MIPRCNSTCSPHVNACEWSDHLEPTHQQRIMSAPPAMCIMTSVMHAVEQLTPVKPQMASGPTRHHIESPRGPVSGVHADALHSACLTPIVTMHHQMASCMPAKQRRKVTTGRSKSGTALHEQAGEFCPSKTCGWHEGSGGCPSAYKNAPSLHQCDTKQQTMCNIQRLTNTALGAEAMQQQH